MIRRIFALVLLSWMLGFAAFAASLPGKGDDRVTDGIIVLTGGPGRIERGIALLDQAKAKRLLVSGVDRSVRRRELDAALGIPERLSACCIDIDKASIDTMSNAEQSAQWITRNKFRTIRLVTTDWHMPRARLELDRALDDSVVVTADAVASRPGLGVLFREYNKYLARLAIVLVRG